MQQPQASASRSAAQAPAASGSPATGSTTSNPPAAAQSGGEPENVNLFEAAAAAAAGRQSGGAPAAGGAPGAGSGDMNFEFLRDNPQFQQLRRLVQEAPHMLEPILQQVAAGNPQLTAMITRYPEAFLRLLGEDDGSNAEGGGGIPGLQTTISVTPEEAAAIDRVCSTHYIDRA